MNLQDLNNEIEYWKNVFQSPSSNDVFYELAFFKIFVKFEQFMIAAFIHYATGGSSHSEYSPKRKLEFQSLPHLEGIFIIESKKYLVEKPESIQQLAKHIFKDDDNPFESIFTDAQFSDNLTYMRTIRNYMAHGSQESQKKYRQVICNNGEYIEPFVYLLKKRKGVKVTNYTFFIDLIAIHCTKIFQYSK